MKSLRYILPVGAIFFVGYLFSPAIVSDGAVVIWVYVKVVDFSTRQPIESAKVELKSARINRDPDIYGNPPEAIKVTDEAGRAVTRDHFPSGWSTLSGSVNLEGATLTAKADGYKQLTIPVSEEKSLFFFTFWKPGISRTIALQRDASGEVARVEK